MVLARYALHMVWLLAMLAVSGCGFHLRGEYNLPEAMRATYITGNQTELVKDIRRAMKFSGVRVVENEIDATAVLKITKENTEQRVLSLDENRRAREYEIEYSVSYSVTGKKADFNIDERKVKLSRDYLYDTTSVLGNSREQATLIRDMQRDAARLIMLQLQAARKLASKKTEQNKDNKKESVNSEK